MELIDWSRIKHDIHEIPRDVLVVDGFRDLKAHRQYFMTGQQPLDGMPPEYDPDDFVLRYIILMDSPGTPADLIVDPNEKKAWAFRYLGVTTMTPELVGLATHKNKFFTMKRVLFLRLQYNEYYRVLKQLESELTAIEESEMPTDERESKSRQDRMKVLLSNIKECKANLFRNDTSRDVEEALMALVVNEDSGLRPEEVAREYAMGNTIFPDVDILIDPRIDD